MVNQYVYRWQFQVGPGLRVEVEVAASNAISALRSVDRFLEDHGGSTWRRESVLRKPEVTSAGAGHAEGSAHSVRASREGRKASNVANDSFN